MKIDALESLHQKWRACYVENQALRREIECLKGGGAEPALCREIEHLKSDIAEMKRKHAIAMDNAYSDGYEHGLADGRGQKR